MKLYTPPEMSEKLVRLGCVSQSDMYWCLRQGGPIYDAAGGVADYIEDSWLLRHSSQIDYDEDYCQAFEFEDFAGPGDLGLNNRYKRWPGLTFDEVMAKLHSKKHTWVEEVGRGL